MPKRPSRNNEPRLAPLYIITLKSGQEVMTSDILNLPKGTKIRKTPHFALTRKRLKKK